MITTPGGRRLILRADGADGADWHKVPSVYSPAFTAIVEIDRLELRGTYSPGVENARVATFRIELQL